jgi:hypothetical protein
MKYPRICWEIGWYGNGLNGVANFIHMGTTERMCFSFLAVLTYNQKAKMKRPYCLRGLNALDYLKYEKS